MSAEPVKPDTLTVRAALGILAASRRYGLALLSLNVHRPRDPIAACDAFAELTSACTASLGILAHSLRTRRKPAKLPKLRELHSAFATAIGANANVESSVAAAETDLMVDAINTIARLLERRYAQPEDAPAQLRSVSK
jgi:crotonobetainyl-CoA:carnitine CoA-transferase CaiB-like acyl-CoA transferase